MTVVIAIFNALAALPKVLEYMEKLAAFIQTQAQVIRNEQLRKEAAEAAARAKKDKDTSGLDHLFDPTKPDGKK